MIKKKFMVFYNQSLQFAGCFGRIIRRTKFAERSYPGGFFWYPRAIAIVAKIAVRTKNRIECGDKVGGGR